MRPARVGVVAWFATSLLGAFGCRQIAGVGDIVPVPVPDASKRVEDAPADIGFDNDNGCACRGCVTLASNLSAPLSLVVTGGYAYVLDYGPESGQGSLVRVPSGGGKTETLLGGLTRPFSLVSDGTDLYWQAEDSAGGMVVKRPIAGGATTTLASGLPVLQNLILTSTVQFPTKNDVAVTPSDVYFVGFTGAGVAAGVLSVPQAGGMVSTLVSRWPGDGGAIEDLSTLAIVTDGTSLYVATNGTAVGLLRVPLPGGPAVPLVKDLLNPWALALDGRLLYFIDEGLNPFRDATLQVVPTTGGPPTILIKQLTSPWSIAQDGPSVYLAESGGGGRIYAFDVSAAKLDRLAGMLYSPEAIATDSTDVYWTDSSCGTLLKTAK